MLATTSDLDKNADHLKSHRLIVIRQVRCGYGPVASMTVSVAVISTDIYMQIDLKIRNCQFKLLW